MNEKFKKAVMENKEDPWFLLACHSCGKEMRILGWKIINGKSGEREISYSCRCEDCNPGLLELPDSAAILGFPFPDFIKKETEYFAGPMRLSYFLRSHEGEN